MCDKHDSYVCPPTLLDLRPDRGVLFNVYYCIKHMLFMLSPGGRRCCLHDFYLKGLQSRSNGALVLTKTMIYTVVPEIAWRE